MQTRATDIDMTGNHLRHLLGQLILSVGLAAMLSATRIALADQIVHVVQPGEDLYRIGLQYGISWQSIMTANGLYSTNIYAGETLVIPVAAAPAVAVLATSAGAAAAAPTATPQPAAAPAQQAAGPAGVYVIQRGDTLWLIAQRYGITVSALMSANGLADPNRIYFGQVLNIPGPAGNAGKLLPVTGQTQALLLDCESRSAVDWAAYMGTAINELDFFGKLPVTDDPNTGFVGDGHGQEGQIPPSSYGVYAGPVAALLRAYGVSARAEHGLSWDAVRAEIDANRPVIVWVVGQVWYGRAVDYTPASTGQTTLVVPFEHTVMVIGYGANTVIILDGGTVYYRSLSQFLASWGVLGNMAVLHQ
jgi:LysM repeat protein